MQAKVWYTENKKIPYNQVVVRETGKKEDKFGIKFKNFQINFHKTLSKFKIYDTIYTEHCLKIFSNYYLPASIVHITNKEQVKEQKQYSKEEAIDLGIKELREILDNKIENKEHICRIIKNVKEEDDDVEIKLTYEVIENIETYDKIEY